MTNKRIEDAARSLRAVRRYQLDRRTLGSRRVDKYVQDTDEECPHSLPTPDQLSAYIDGFQDTITNKE